MNNITIINMMNTCKGHLLTKKQLAEFFTARSEEITGNDVIEKNTKLLNIRLATMLGGEK